MPTGTPVALRKQARSLLMGAAQGKFVTSST